MAHESFSLSSNLYVKNNNTKIKKLLCMFKSKKVYCENIKTYCGVYVKLNDKIVKVPYHPKDPLDELFWLVDGQMGCVKPSENYYLTCKNKPLRYGFTGIDFDIHYNDTIIVNPILKGGCVIEKNGEIQPYSCSVIIEDSFLKKQLQNNTRIFKEMLSGDMDALISMINSCLHNKGFKNTTITGDYIAGIFEDLMFMYKDSKHYGAYDCIIRFLKYRGYKTREILNFIMEKIGIIELQNDAYEFDGNIFSFLKSEFFKKVFGIVSFIVLKDGLKELKLDLSDKNLVDLIFKYGKILITDGAWHPVKAVFDNICFVLKRIYKWLKSGNINALYSDYYVDDAWFDKAMELIYKSQFLANPEPHDINVFTYLFDLDYYIEIGENSYKNYQGDAKKRNVLSKVLSDLKRVRGSELTKQAAMKPRKSPMSLLVYATSSTGKSTFLEILYGYYGNLFGLDTAPEFKYTRQSDDPYWSNFRTYCWCVVLDDAAFMRPDIATNGDPSVMEIIKIKNNVTYVTPQAELQDKGTVPMRCELVLATTNSEDLNATHYFSCPLAVQRRFPFVVNLEVKEEYGRDDSAKMLDSAKVPPSNKLTYPNLWNIKVKKVEANPLDPNQAVLRVCESFDDINEFLVWFGKESLKHDKEQKLTMSSMDDIRDITVCKDCLRTCTLCQCFEHQNDEVEIVPWYIYLIRFIIQIIYIIIILVSTFFGTTYIMDPKHPNFKKHCIRYLHNLGWLIYIVKIRVAWFDAKEKLNFWWSMHKTKIYSIIILYNVVMTIRNIMRDNRDAFQTQVEEENAPVNGNESSMECSTPEFSQDTSANVWYNKTVELAPSEMPEASKSIQDINIFKNLVARNTALFRITNMNKKTVSDGQALNVKGNLWLTNYHNVNKLNYEEEFWLELIRSNSSGINNNIKCRIDPSMIIRIGTKDAVLVKVLNAPPGRDLTKFFSQNVLPGTHNGLYIIREKSGVLNYKKLENIKNHVTSTFENCTQSEGYIGVPHEDTVRGESGATLILNTPQGLVIGGIHQAGAVKMCLSVHISVDDLNHDCISEGDLRLKVQGYEKILGDLHPKSVPRWVDSGTCNIYGTFQGFRPKPKSRVQTSYICDAAIKRGYSIQQGAPVMSGWEPWRIAFIPMVNMPNNFRYCDVKACTDAFIDDVSGTVLKLGYLSDYESINGLPGVKYIDGINRNTSMGFPWSCSKKNYLMPDIREEYSDGVNFPAEIWDLAHEIERKYLAGESAKPIFTGHLKDEPRSFKKIREKKTRVFAGAPVDWSLVVRKALLTFVKAFQENKELFEAAPGLNCQSLEWDQLYKHVTKFGTTNFVAGDYGNFDKSMLSMFIMEAFRFIRSIHEINGCSQEHLKIIDGIAVDTAYNFQNFNGDLIQFFGSNPSGHPLTVVINSIVNALYMRYVYGKLNPEGFKPENFKRDVILMTYGDDNFMNVRDGCEWFNHTTIQKCLADVGIKYTMADKEAESIPYIDIKDVSFLKRTFRYDEDLNCYLAPLDHESLNKMLTVQVRSKSVSREAQALASIQSAIREYFFYGKREFEYRRKLLKEIIEESGLQNYLISHTENEDGEFILCSSDLPTWEELKTSFFYNSRHITGDAELSN